jgi:hypothetical protein
MTATTRPKARGRHSAQRPLRFSSLESLGFADSARVWTEPPRTPPDPIEPETLPDWRPEEFGDRLDGSNVRWSVVALVVATVLAVGAVGFWLSQRPAAEAEAAASDLIARAGRVEAALPALEEFNRDLLTAEVVSVDAALVGLEREVRSLFEASGEVGENGAGVASASADAVDAALEGVRLAREATAYRLAVLSILAVPALETDPSLVALDEAARLFGDWQLTFDETREALPRVLLPETTDRLAALSADLPSLLNQYMDALREDDAAAAEAVLTGLGARLIEVDASMKTALEGVQDEVREHITATRTALATILGD